MASGEIAAWGRVALATSRTTISDGDGGTITSTQSTHAYQYDALGRQISAATKDGGGTVTAINRLFYNGQNVIEERSGLTGAVTNQYVWSAAGPNTLILRDSQSTPSSPGTSSLIPQVSGSPLNQRLYAQDNGQGSVTSITSVTGAVQERYLYDQDGQPQAVQANWSAWNDGSATLQVNHSHDRFSSMGLYAECDQPASQSRASRPRTPHKVLCIFSHRNPRGEPKRRRVESIGQRYSADSVKETGSARGIDASAGRG